MEEVDDEDDSGGEVVGILCSMGDLVLAIFAGGGWERVWPKMPCGKTSLGPKLGFKMLSIENGRARLTWNGLSLVGPNPE